MNDLSKNFINSENTRKFLKDLVGVESQEGEVFTFTGLDKEQRQNLYSSTGNGIGFSKIDDSDATIEVYSTDNITSVSSESSGGNNSDDYSLFTLNKLKTTVEIQTSVIRHMDHQIKELRNEIRTNSVVVIGIFGVIFYNLTT